MGIFAGLLNLSLSCRRVKLAGRKFLLGSLIVVALVTLEEFTQRLIPYRSFDGFDLLADYLGVIVFGRVALWPSSKGKEDYYIFIKSQPHRGD